MSRLPKNNFQKGAMQGLTLVELLISMGISAIILAGSVVVYLDQLQSSRRLSAFAQLQESGRVALDIIEQDLRMSDYVGCISSNIANIDDEDELKINNTLLGTYPSTFQPEVGIQGWEASSTAYGETITNVMTSTALVLSDNGDWTSSGGNNLDKLNVVPNSDIIRVWGGSDAEAVVKVLTVSSPNTITIASDSGIEDNDILLLSDCDSLDIVQACDLSTSSGDDTLTLGTSCSPGNDAAKPLVTSTAQLSSVTALKGTTYVVSKHGGLALNPPSLFRAQLNTTGAVIGSLEEVVQGVESMQILYGENTDKDNLKSADVYVTANNVTDWINVVSVRISLLLQSVDDNLADGALPYVFNGVTYDGQGANPSPADERLRRVFSRTVSLRNRTLGT